MSNKFGIILPTIGRESLREAVESVLKQSYQDWNLLISWDRHEAYRVLCSQGWISDDYRIINLSEKKEKQSNDSGASARNSAYPYVPLDCNWVCYIDDDDIWHEDRLKAFNNFIEGHEVSEQPLDLFYSYGDLYKLKHRSPRSSKKVLKRIGIIDNVTCGGMCHRRELFEKTSGWNPNNTEDHDRELYDQMRRYGSHDVLESSTFDFIWRS